MQCGREVWKMDYDLFGNILVEKLDQSMWKRNKSSLWWIVIQIDTFLLNTCPGVLHSFCSERHAHLKEKASKISKFSRKLEVATKAGECFQTFKIVRDCNQGRGNY